MIIKPHVYLEMSLDIVRINVHIHLMSFIDPTDIARCTCAALRRASRMITQNYDAALQPAGLRATQFTLLASLTRIGPIPLTQLADALVMDRTTLTRNLRPLIAKGWIASGEDQDQRVRVIELTDAGQKIFDAALPLWEAAQTRIVAALGVDRWSGIIDDLSATTAAAHPS